MKKCPSLVCGAVVVTSIQSTQSNTIKGACLPILNFDDDAQISEEVDKGSKSHPYYGH
jgi:hypothetical protein